MASPSEHERSVANLAAAIIAPPVKKRNRLKLRDEPVLVKIMQESGVKAKRQVERKKKAKLDEAQKQNAVAELAERHSSGVPLGGLASGSAQVGGPKEKQTMGEVRSVAREAREVSQDAGDHQRVRDDTPVDHGVPGVHRVEVVAGGGVPVAGDKSAREHREEHSSSGPRRARAAQRQIRGVDIAPQVHEYLLKRNGPYYRLQFAAAAGLVAGAAAYSYAPAIVAALNM